MFLLILILMACGLPNISTTPPDSPQFSNHIIVSLTEPLDGEAYPVSAGLSIRAEAISDGSIARMELWADGTLYEDYTAPEDGLGLLVHYWTWSPKTLGGHTLMVRAYDDQNQTAFSNVIQIKGIEDPGYILIAKVESGDTIASIAERYNVALDEILRDNPGFAGSASLSEGEEVLIQINASKAASLPSLSAKVSMKINEWFANGQRGFLGPSSAPSAPTLDIVGQGCNAVLSISDHSTNEQGFQIYRLNPGSISFSKLTTLPAHDGVDAISQTDLNLYGLYHYYVSAFDDAGEAAGNLVSINITDSTCAGEPTPIESLASIPAGVEDYYLYVAINNGKWRRFPADEFAYLKKSQGMDFGQVAASLAPNLAGSFSMRGEVWGMVNETATLLGTFEKSFKTGQAPAVLEPSGFYQSLTTKLEVRGAYSVSTQEYGWLKEGGTAYEPRIFRFGTDSTAQYGIWQVASVPFQSDASLNPACLLLTDKTNGSGAPGSPYQFNIDFSPLKPKIESLQLSPFENSLSLSPVFSAPYSPGNLGGPAQQVVNIPKGNGGAFAFGGKSPVFSNFDPCAQNVSAKGVVTYYVRILPVNNGQPAGKPSNTVILGYDPKGEIKITIPHVPVPNQTYYDVKIVNFTGVHVPDPNYEFCVELVENNVKPPSPWAGFKPGTVFCPQTDQGGEKDFLEQVADAVENAFNFIGGLYNKLSDWVTDLVEKLNPLCIQAKLASKAVDFGEKEVKDACHFIAVAAVTAAKTYAGLPPSIPNFDQLTELGKENLVELAAQELEDQGIPCPEDCKQVISQGIDYSLEQVKKSMSNSSCMSEQEAGEHGIKPLCFPSGMITKPDPRGQPAPAVAEVQVTRRPGATGPDFPEPKSCNVSISAYAKNDSHIGKSYSTAAGFHWQGSPIEGDLLNGAGAFPNLQPGESTKIPIILTPNPYWLAGHQEFVKKGWKPEHYDDWYFLYQGALATLNAGGACKFEFPEGIGFSNVAVNGDTMQVGPLGNAWAHTCHPYNCP
jgi:hypothetical protein